MSTFDTYSAADIRVVTRLRDAPPLFLGALDGAAQQKRAANRVVFELVANVVDLFLRGEATSVSVCVDGDELSVRDDGPGLPFETPAPHAPGTLATRYLLHRHDTASADGHAPHVHVGPGGLGLALVNQAAAWLRVESTRGGLRYRQSFAEGTCDGPVTSAPATQPGSLITLQLAPSLFGGHGFDMPNLRRTLFEVAHLYPGLVVGFQDERFVSHAGLLDLAHVLAPPAFGADGDRAPRTLSCAGQHEGVDIRVGALGDADGYSVFRTWVNGLEAAEGTHVDAARALFAEAGWAPRQVLMRVVMHKPRFAGPTTEVLTSDVVGAAVRAVLGPALAPTDAKEAP